MLSKTAARARTAVLCILLTGCASALPWQEEEPKEINLAIVVERNLLMLPSAEINGRKGRIFFGSATPQTVLSPAFAGELRTRSYRLQMNEKESLPLRPVLLDLGGIGDAMIGADAWTSRAVTIDYLSGLLTYQKEGIYPTYMTLYRFQAEPSVMVEINGRQLPAVVDTALPDTLALPRGTSAAGRTQAHVALAGADLGTVDVALADVTQARIGNRLLSKFLVTIDYGRQQVGLWRDPRIPLE